MTKQELTYCIDAYGKAVYSFCKYLTGSMQEAEELYQDTWLKVVEHLETIDANGNVKSYCLSVAIRIWKNRKRKYAWRKRILKLQTEETEADAEALVDDQPLPGERMLGKERDEAVRRAVNALPDRLKSIVLLYYMEELSAAQIAKTEGIPVGTVKSRLHQARKILKKKLEVVLDEI